MLNVNVTAPPEEKTGELPRTRILANLESLRSTRPGFFFVISRTKIATKAGKISCIKRSQNDSSLSLMLSQNFCF